jgi:hypothetical protein
MSDVLQREDFDCGRVWFRESFRHWDACKSAILTMVINELGRCLKGATNQVLFNKRNIF